MAPSDKPLKRATSANENSLSRDLAVNKTASTPSKAEAYVDLLRPPEAEFNLAKLKTGELLKLIGQRTVRMHEIAELCSHNLLNTPQTAATFRMLNRANTEATKLFLQGAAMIQAIKFKPGSDHIVTAQINLDKGLDAYGMPRRTYTAAIKHPPIEEEAEPDDDLELDEDVEDDYECDDDVEPSDEEDWQDEYDDDDA